MKQSIYLFSDTIIKRNSNTIIVETIKEDDEYETEERENEYFLSNEIVIPSGDKKYIPVENIEAIFAVGSLHFNSRFLYFLSQNNIPLHILNYQNRYAGSYLSAGKPVSGSLLIKQAQAFLSSNERMHIAMEFVNAAAHNTIANLKYHQNRKAVLSDFIEYITDLKEQIKSCKYINELMGIEGAIKKVYYTAWKEIFNYPLNFNKRIKNPPPDIINSLISYGNAIVYAVCLSEIYHTRLNPEIGFLHEPADAQLSLSFDIADIFKPIFTDRAIFKVINKNIITEKDYFTKNGFCRIKKEAKKKFTREIENTITTTIKNRETDKQLSYKRLVREECYKLAEHFKKEKIYTAYKTRW
ncbi:MAG: type I-B CRISPR-associated endonuclease Cas1 [Ignavibacteriae bacterium]|nr:type I-B CRISPR-associated endonuclease Cas1 [Ignavibacteriota bacterium]